MKDPSTISVGLNVVDAKHPLCMASCIPVFGAGEDDGSFIRLEARQNLNIQKFKRWIKHSYNLSISYESELLLGRTNRK